MVLASKRKSSKIAIIAELQQSSNEVETAKHYFFNVKLKFIFFSEQPS